MSIGWWIFSSIASACLGAAALAYIKDTKLGVWGYIQFQKIANYFKKKFNIKVLDENPTGWRVLYPDLAKKIDDLEKKINN